MKKREAENRRRRLPANRRGRFGAFTLIELLVVMSIMVLLAGLLLAAMAGMQKTAGRKKAKVQIAAMELGLERFERDFGDFPINEADPVTDSEAGAKALYQALSGDGNDLLGLAFTPSESSTGELGSSQQYYLEQLNPTADTQGMIVTTSSGEYYVSDPWRQPFRYVRYEVAADRQANQHNPASYDLWSHGHADTGEPDAFENDEEKWITNWD